jgi:hypothetical protein
MMILQIPLNAEAVDNRGRTISVSEYLQYTTLVARMQLDFESHLKGYYQYTKSQERDKTAEVKLRTQK